MDVTESNRVNEFRQFKQRIRGSTEDVACEKVWWKFHFFVNISRTSLIFSSYFPRRIPCISSCRLEPAWIADSREFSPGVVIDYAANGDIVGIDIDNASTKLDPKEIVLKSISVDTQTIAA